MAESKNDVKIEGKVSSRAMEAAMVARLFKDALENANPIVSHFILEKDDGQQLEMSPPKAHPSFPNPEIACRRLEQRIAQWVSGDKPGLDKNALARLEVSGIPPFDLSMESFEKAALSDDGQLVIAVGFTQGVGREPMELNKNLRLKLYAKDGTIIGRRQALLPIKEIIQIQKKEREAQAKRLATQEQDFDADDLGRALSKEEDRQWADLNQEPLPSTPSTLADSRPTSVSTPTSTSSLKAPAFVAKTHSSFDGVDKATKMMEMAIHAVNKNMGAQLKTSPLPFSEVKHHSNPGSPVWDDPELQHLWDDRVAQLEKYASESFAQRVLQLEQYANDEIEKRVAVRLAEHSSPQQQAQLSEMLQQAELRFDQKWKTYAEQTIHQNRQAFEDQQRADRHALEQSYLEQKNLQKRIEQQTQEIQTWVVKYETSENEWLDDATLQKNEYDQHVLELVRQNKELETQKNSLQEHILFLQSSSDQPSLDHPLDEDSIRLSQNDIQTLKNDLHTLQTELELSSKALEQNRLTSQALLEKNDADWALKFEDFKRNEGPIKPSEFASIVKTEIPASKIDPDLMKAVFPDLPEGFDEVLISVDKHQLFEALESLENYGSFEARLASRGAHHMAFGLAVPSGKIAILSDFIAQFSKAGVIIKRHPVQ